MCTSVVVLSGVLSGRILFVAFYEDTQAFLWAKAQDNAQCRFYTSHFIRFPVDFGGRTERV